MGTQTWERPMTWASGRHGSKPAREMTTQTLWLLPISGNVPAAYSAATGTFLPTPSLFPGEDLMLAADSSLVGLEPSD